MAQSGFTPIQIYYSTTSGNTPLAANLASGELALNTADGILFYKDSSGVVEVLASGSSVSILSVVAATTANLASLSGLLTVDGVVLTAGQRVLVKDQTLSQNNGVYLASAGAWTRSIDANSSAEIAGRIISVRSGSANGGEQWATTFKSTDTLGTTAMSWFQVALQNTAVTFTDLTTTGNTTLGNASADTVTVNGTSTFSAKPTVQLTTATTNAVTQVFQLNSQSSGTPANGIGVGMEFAVETTAGNTEIGATIDAVVTDVTAASEDFDLVVKLMAAGAAAAETARFKSTGLSLITGDTYQISGVDVLSATTLGTAVVNSSLTSVGTIATGTWNATDIALGAGGTNASLTAVNGGVVYSTATAMAITAAGTAGQALVSNGAAAPTFQELTLANLPGAWVKKAVDCATTAALTINTAQTTIDGVTLSASSRVLVKDQATASQNGIYTNVTTVSWTRTTDADAAAEVAGGTVSVDAGTVNGGAIYTTSFKSTDTVGTTAMNWYRVFDGSTIVPAANGGTGVNNATRTLTINTNSGTLAFGAASKTLTINNSIALTGTDATTMTFPSTSQTLAGLGLAQTFTFAQTFRAANAVRSEAAATQDAVVLAGRAGGTSSFAVTLTPTTLTANRTITLPDGDIVLPTGTYAVLNAAQTFTAAQTFRAANSVRAEAAATQDAIVLAGRAGGTGSFAVSLTPTTLSANRTLTLPNVTDTVAVLGTAQTFTAAQTFRAANAVRSEAAATQDAIILAGRAGGTGSFGATITTATLAASVTHTLPAITGTLATLANTAQTFTGATTFSNASTTFSATTPVVAVPANGLTIQPTTATQSTLTPLIVANSPTGAWTAEAGVNLQFSTSYNSSGTSTPYYAANLLFSYNSSDVNTLVDFKSFDPTGNNYSFLNNRVGIKRTYVGSGATGDYFGSGGGSRHIYGETGVNALGYNAGVVDFTLSGFPTFAAYPTYSTYIGHEAGGVYNRRNSGPVNITMGGEQTAVGVNAGNLYLDDSGSSGTTTTTVGSANTSLGSYAGQIVITNAGTWSRGTFNIGIGPSATRQINQNFGDSNIGIGDSALRAATGSVGSYNTAIGVNAGNAGGMGNNNTFIGPSSGISAPLTIEGATLLGGHQGAGISNYDTLLSSGGQNLALYATGGSPGVDYTDIYLGGGTSQIKVRNTNGVVFLDSEFKIIDNTDTTKVAQFQCSGITTATTRTLTVPNDSGTLALLSGTQTFSGATTFSSTFTLSGTTTNTSLNAGQTTGTIIIGGTAGTGAITVGQSTGAQTLNLGTGATLAATTKTVNIGTAGVSTSVTNINIGSAVSGATGTTTLSSSSIVLNGAITSGNIAFTLSGTTSNLSLNAGQTSGTIVIGGTAATGTITVGQSTGIQILNLGTGATANTVTKTVNIGTTGVSGSITNVNIGSAVAGSLGTISLNEQLVVTQPTPVTIATTATLTNANILTRIVIASGATDYTITLPLGTTLETLVTWVGVDLAYDFTFIPTGGATVTLGANTGVTIVGANQFSQFGGSVTFRIRRTAANTFIVYNMG